MNSITIAGRTYTRNLDKLKILGYRCSASGTTNASSLCPMEDPATGYQVPVGKKLVIFAVVGGGDNAGINALGYADNDNGVAADPSTLTNPLPDPSDMANGAVWISTNGGSNPPTPVAIDMEVPAGKYPFALGWGTNSEATGFVYAFELDV